MKKTKMIDIRNLCKDYTTNGKSTAILKDISFSIGVGELALITGASGSGKSTLLNLIGGLDQPTSGKITVDDLDISKLGKDERADYRAKKVAFIFQSYNLLNGLNVEDNIKIVKEITKNQINVDKLLKDLDIEGKGKMYPETLSGGQQQRVSIARSLAKNTPVLLCDEPTGALDSKTGDRIMELLKSLSKEGKTILIVTHNLEYVRYADRIIQLKDGHIQDTDEASNDFN